MFEYTTGTLYHAGKTHWQAGTDFNFRAGILELRLFFCNLTDSDIRAIRDGDCSFYVAVTGDVIWFLFEFGKACPLSDNSYSIHLVAENERTMPPELGADERAILTVILVSTEDGIIQAMRQIALGHSFSRTLYRAIAKQCSRPFSKSEHDATIAQTYKRYPTSTDLLSICVATCVVGGV